MLWHCKHMSIWNFYIHVKHSIFSSPPFSYNSDAFIAKGYRSFRVGTSLTTTACYRCIQGGVPGWVLPGNSESSTGQQCKYSANFPGRFFSKHSSSLLLQLNKDLKVHKYIFRDAQWQGKDSHSNDQTCWSASMWTRTVASCGVSGFSFGSLSSQLGRIDLALAITFLAEKEQTKSLACSVLKRTEYHHKPQLAPAPRLSDDISWTDHHIWTQNSLL